MVKKRLRAVNELLLSLRKCSGLACGALEGPLELVAMLGGEVLSKANPRYAEVRAHKARLEERKRPLMGSPNMSQPFPDAPEFEIGLAQAGTGWAREAIAKTPGNLDPVQVV